MKRTLIWISGIIAIIVCGAWFGLHYLQNGYLAQHISDATKKATGSPLVFKQDPAISLFPPTIKFGATSWAGSSNGAQINFTAKGGVAELDLEKLFGGKLEIRDIILDKPAFEIVETSAAPQTGSPAFKDSGSFSLGRLMVLGGSVIYKTPRNVIIFDKINLSAENLRRRQEADIKFDFALTMAPVAAGDVKTGDSSGEFSGNLAFKAKMRYYEPNLTFRHAAATFTPTESGLSAEFSPVRLAFDGGVNFNDWNFLLHNANLAIPQATLDLKGEGNLLKGSFEGNGNLEASISRLASCLGLKTADPAKTENDSLIVAGPVNLRGGILTMNDVALKLANGSGTGRLAIDLPPSRDLAIEGHVDIGNVALNAFSMAPESVPKKAAREDAVKISSAADYPEINFRVDIAALDFCKLHVSRLGFLLHGRAGTYRVDDFTFNVANGGVLASMQANLSTNEMSMQANGQDVDLGLALNEMGIEGLASGRTRFEASLQATGDDLRALKSSISGKGQLESRGLKVPALNSIVQILQLFDSRDIDLGDSFTVISALFSAENGHVHFSPITATSRGVSLEGGALVNLREDYLDGTANIKALGLELPLTFAGPFTDIKLGVNPDVILNANKNVPKTFLRSIDQEEKPRSQPPRTMEAAE